MRAVLTDVGPLRRHRAYRRLLVGQAVSGLGSQLTVVAVAYQAYALTRSSLIVGLVSLVQLGPNLVGAMGGGTVADAVDRRRALVAAQLMLAAASAALAANAWTGHPRLWVLFVAAAASAGFQGLDWPTRMAVLPMIVPAEDLTGAVALQSLVSNGALVAGPAFAGVLIAGLGLGAVYAIDVATFGATLLAALALPALPPTGGGTPVSFASVREGLRFLRAERLLAATVALDFVAMSFGMPKAVFPALGLRFFHGGATTVGLLYAAPGAGALVGSAFSGWVKRVANRGRALVACMVVWGGAITAFGLVPLVGVGLVLLGVAGGADAVGTVYRTAILQSSTPQALQGRLSGAFFAAAIAGNRVGDTESGAVASLGGAQLAVWSGGLACLVGTAVLVWRVPQLWGGRPAAAGGPEDPAVAVAVPAVR